MNALPPGATFSRAEASDMLRLVPGLIVSGDEVISPTGDVVPLTLQVLRTTMGLTIASTVQPDFALQGSANPDIGN